MPLAPSVADDLQVCGGMPEVLKTCIGAPSYFRDRNAPVDPETSGTHLDGPLQATTITGHESAEDTLENVGAVAVVQCFEYQEQDPYPAADRLVPAPEPDSSGLAIGARARGMTWGHRRLGFMGLGAR